MQRHYTLVLKGHLAVAAARFPRGTAGAAIDAFARAALWRHGLDFDHGTGHGVGSFLSVHEGPQSLSKRSLIALEPGMIISNEPGYYKEGAYGIRIENLEVVREPERLPGSDRDTMTFETLTLVPYDRRLIDPGLLTADELAAVNAYHARVRDRIGPELGPVHRAWLEAATAPLEAN
jgi:Xaa-Pro aminopeptidase